VPRTRRTRPIVPRTRLHTRARPRRPQSSLTMVQREREARGTRHSAQRHAHVRSSSSKRNGEPECTRPSFSGRTSRCASMFTTAMRRALPRATARSVLAVRCRLRSMHDGSRWRVRTSAGSTRPWRWGSSGRCRRRSRMECRLGVCERGLGVRAQRSTCACGPAAAVPRSMIEPTTSVSCS